MNDTLRLIFGAVVFGDFLLAILIAMLMSQRRQEEPHKAGQKSVRRGIHVYCVVPDAFQCDNGPETNADAESGASKE